MSLVAFLVGLAVGAVCSSVGFYLLGKWRLHKLGLLGAADAMVGEAVRRYREGKR